MGMMPTTSAVARNFPTLRYLGAPFRWFFRSRQRVMTAAAVIVAILLAMPLWWSIQLMGLPDIGEPFDVEAFRTFTIPDDRNALVLYHRAADRLRPIEAMDRAKVPPIDREAAWSKAGPIVRRWVEANRETLELFRRGADRPEALRLVRPRDSRGAFVDLGAFYPLRHLALLEASRLEDRADLEGAWSWYRAVLRAAHHVAMRGTIYERWISRSWRVEVNDRLGPWSEDPRTTPAMLRRALDDVLACEALLPRETDTIKSVYLSVIDNPDGRFDPARQALIQRLKRVYVGSTELQLDQRWIEPIADAWRLWRREPERSRRVLRLTVANWLAYYDLPPDRRRAPSTETSGRYDFYAFGPEAPARARALSTAALDRWLATTADAQEWLMRWDFRALRYRERADHRALVLLLARQLYRRDRGADPPSDEALVGPYLEKLPDDGLGYGKAAGGSAGTE